MTFYHKYEEDLSKPIEAIVEKETIEIEKSTENSFKEIYDKTLECKSSSLIDFINNTLPDYFSSLDIEDAKENKTIQDMIKDVLLEKEQLNMNYKKKCSTKEEGIDPLREYKLQILLYLYILFFLKVFFILIFFNYYFYYMDITVQKIQFLILKKLINFSFLCQ